MVFIKKLITVLVIIGLGAVTGCHENNSRTPAGKLVSISLQQEWFPYSGFAGELVAMNETASKNDLDIKVYAGSENIDPIKLVLGGSKDFGVAPSDRILAANEKGADLVVIGAIESRSPVCFLTRTKDHILTPHDFIGKKAGVINGVQSELVYRTLLSKSHVDPKSVKEVNIPFGLETFILGDYDIRPAFIYNETLALKEKGISYNIIRPEDYGVTFIGSVYFTTRKYIQKNPMIVQEFINSIADGWEIALKDPKKAIEYLKKFDNTINSKREYQSLLMALDYYKPQNGRILYADMQRWQEMYDNLKELKAIDSVDLNKTVDYDFINSWNKNK